MIRVLATGTVACGILTVASFIGSLFVRQDQWMGMITIAFIFAAATFIGVVVLGLGLLDDGETKDRAPRR